MIDKNDYIEAARQIIVSLDLPRAQQKALHRTAIPLRSIADGMAGVGP